jgi:hypothetical protein
LYANANPFSFVDPWGLAYSSMGEHGIPNDLVGGKDPNACGCLDKVLGIDTAVGGGLVAGGQPGIDKPFNMKGASTGTSPLSKGLSKAFPQQLPWRLPAPTQKNWRAKSKVAGRVLGRWAPIVGWELLAKDYIQYLSCIAKCEGDECKQQ